MITNLPLKELPQLYPIDDSNQNNSAYIFINGVLQVSQVTNLQEKINATTQIILADGGTKHFLLLQSHYKSLPKPSCLVGDLDSITEEDSNILNSLSPNLPIHQFPRDKDYSDFEAALQMLKLHALKEVLVVAGLGKRLDHSLSNLLVILRKAYCGRVSFLWNQQDKLVSIGENKPLQLHHSQGSYLRLFPADGDFKVTNIWGLEREDEGFRCIKDDASLTIDGKTCLCLIQKDNEAASPFNYPSSGSIKYEFFANQDISIDLQLLYHLIAHPNELKIITFLESIVCIDSSKKFESNSTIGQTISLIPFSGKVSGINTQGLHWELKEGSLSKNFIGLSNIAKDTSFSISVKEGKLLCILNNFQDMDMINIVNNNK